MAYFLVLLCFILTCWFEVTQQAVFHKGYPTYDSKFFPPSYGYIFKLPRSDQPGIEEVHTIHVYNPAYTGDPSETQHYAQMGPSYIQRVARLIRMSHKYPDHPLFRRSAPNYADPLANLPADIENLIQKADRDRCSVYILCYAMAYPDHLSSGPFIRDVKQSFRFQPPMPVPTINSKFSDWMRFGVSVGKLTKDVRQCPKLAPQCSKRPDVMLKEADKIYQSFRQYRTRL